MSKTIKLLIGLLFLVSSAWGATGYLPVKFAPGDQADDADSVWAYVFDASGVVDSASLTHDTSTLFTFWRGQFTVTLDSVYHVGFRAWYDGETDSLQLLGSPILMPDPASYRGTGSGAQLCSLLVLDTSGSDAAVANAKVSIYGDGYTGSPWTPNANGSGWAVFNTDASTAYDVVVGPIPGYTFDSYDMTTGSGATFTDTVMGYDQSIGTPSVATLKRIYGWEYDHSREDSSRVPVQGCRVVYALELTPRNDMIPADTAAGVNLSYYYTASATTDANGFWHLDIPLNSNVVPSGSRSSVTCYRPGSTAERWKLTKQNYTTTTTLCIGGCP